LYGTETLFGDWDSRVLLLAKDGAPTSAIRNLAQREGDGAWRHADRQRGDPSGWKTNEQLAELASLIQGPKLFGSATANMLCDIEGYRRSLPDFWKGPLHEHLIYTLGWVVGAMTRERIVIACLGDEAWHITCHTIGVPAAAKLSRECRDLARPVAGRIGNKPVTALAMNHPTAHVTDECKVKQWQGLAALVHAQV
jgi:hypothetical protein